MGYAKGLMNLKNWLYHYVRFLSLIVIFVTTSATAKADAGSDCSPDGTIAAGKDVMETIINTLTCLTCETQGVGDLLRSEFSHTCIPAPMFTFVVANIISPGLYANTFLRVKINDDELFPGACKRENRIDFNDQKISFAMCNNIDLAVQRVGAIAKSAVAIAYAFLTGADPWQAILNAWDIPKKDFHKMYLDKREGDEDTMVDLGIIPIFPWKIIKENDKLCVATQSFSGWIPIGCKYIKEPYPKSIYYDFMDLTPDGSDTSDPHHLTACSGSDGCYQKAYSNSKTSVVISGPLVECVKTMIARLMISDQVCSIDDIKTVLSSSARSSSSLFQFQVNMHKIVAALLTLYVILFGMKMVLSGDVPEKRELVNFVLKFLFVIYFSIGININPGTGSNFSRLDGLVEWVFPFLLGGITQMANWVISASPSELCKFSASEYTAGMEHIALWDSLDCRVAHYIGLDVLQTIVVDNAMREHDFGNFDILSFPIPPYIYLLIPAVISGNMTLVSLALMYPMMVISVAAFVVNATVVCMISIVMLGILAPLFVPMYLFEYTKGYFESYVKLMISFMLQPMVAVTFMTTMLSVYDYGFYGSCKYKSTTLSETSRSMKVFYVDNDWDGYDSLEDIDGCKNSLGFILNNPLAFLFDTTVDLANAAFPNLNDPSRNTEEGKFSFLKAIQPSPGMFFDMVEVLYEKIKTLITSLLTAVFTLYLMYHFSESLSDFAADMTEGVSTGNMGIKPGTLYKPGMKAGMFAAGKISQAIAKGKDKSQATDATSSGESDQAEDSTSSSGKTGSDDSASDKVGVPRKPISTSRMTQSSEDGRNSADSNTDSGANAGKGIDKAGGATGWKVTRKSGEYRDFYSTIGSNRASATDQATDARQEQKPKPKPKPKPLPKPVDFAKKFASWSATRAADLLNRTNAVTGEAEPSKTETADRPKWKEEIPSASTGQNSQPDNKTQRRDSTGNTKWQSATPRKNKNTMGSGEGEG